MSKQASQSTKWIDEIHLGVRYGLQGRVLHHEKSKFQDITIVDTERYGKALLLDNCWMTAEKQERHYHECLVQPAICSAAKLKKILVIGGGDGGTARECLRHNEVEHLDMVEIDSRVIDLSKKYLPQIGGSAWNDRRFHLNIEDGVAWVNNAKDSSYDVVLIDGSDPAGPAEGLFNKSFFKNCKRILQPDGVFATQSESPEAFRKIHIETVRIIKDVFNYADPLYGWVPMYPSGWWSWIFAANDSPRYLNPKQTRSAAVIDQCEIWSPRWQKGGFDAIPAFIAREIAS